MIEPCIVIGLTSATVGTRSSDGFLNQLDGAHICYTLGHTRPESVMVDISPPGWRWEVEFMIDGSVEIERYQSVAGVEDDAQLLEVLFVQADRSRQPATDE
jgi:hypothetical protein